ncbi:Zinc finger CCCH domain-containing protein 66 [Hibiscus syriacus]|uniref:Zinc finger CCCH domain-containing protein 66 n=1 Tax=Hibiscus syriacus TaxID=106335 RepID=A0A6A3ADE6_HIBSY|nr:zinc finger CCCH domain-containing protein 66-like [Hibiscus syriacus]KAE8700882.1 Zinc finger CCCH domain-containing protein 66 [Hibiscus syriacus]
MCSGPKRKATQSGLIMEGESGKEDGVSQKFSVLLGFSASNDLIAFKTAVEEEGHDIDEPSLWYGRRLGSKKMGFEERTPLLIASLFGSKDVVNYIVESGRVDVNRACGSDGAMALHCAAAGGSFDSAEVVKTLLHASADADSLDANGKRPSDLIAPVRSSAFGLRKKVLESLLKVSGSGSEMDSLPAQLGNEMGGMEEQEYATPRVSKDGTERKEYPVDLTLPDIKNGIYGTDEFRMYTFKVKPCSRAYSHDWTECPFVHPGENARRRDPRKYHYSCVPCPEFRKGSCRQGDNCEYAHGIFECWLHPAQYRTRLCKDETNCTRRVCFFAHKPEELRPLYASTGSAVPSPRSYLATSSSLDMGPMSPFAPGSPSVMIPPMSTPLLTPTGASSPMAGSMWPNQSNIIPPTLQLPGSRLKTTVSVRDMDLDMELLGLESQHRPQQQQLIDEMTGLSSPTSWKNSASFFASGDRTSEINRLGGVKPTNLEDIFGSPDPSIMSQIQGLSLDASGSQLQSPAGVHTLRSINQQLRPSYPSNLPSSPVRTSASFGIDPSGPSAAAVLSSRSAAFAKRSQSFVERTAVNRHSGLSSPASSASGMTSNLSDWVSPDGKLDWGIHGEELNKLRKSASFGFRSSGSNLVNAAHAISPTSDEPDVSWVQSLVVDPPLAGQLSFDDEQQCHHNNNNNNGGAEMVAAWVEQLYMEQKQMVT